MTLKNHKVNVCLEFELRGYWTNIVENLCFDMNYYKLPYTDIVVNQSELADFIYKKNHTHWHVLINFWLAKDRA